MLEEVKDGKVTLTPFDPEDVLHEVHDDVDVVYEFTVQDMLDEVGKVTED